MATRRKNATKESLGQRLARARKQRGLTQVELAERIGLSQPNVSDYERDLFRPNSDTIVKIAKVLQVSADELLGLTRASQAKPTLSPKLVRRMAQIERLPANDRRALLKTIDNFLKAAEA